LQQRNACQHPSMFQSSPEPAQRTHARIMRHKQRTQECLVARSGRFLSKLSLLQQRRPPEVLFDHLWCSRTRKSKKILKFFWSVDCGPTDCCPHLHTHMLTEMRTCTHTNALTNSRTPIHTYARALQTGRKGWRRPRSRTMIFLTIPLFPRSTPVRTLVSPRVYTCLPVRTLVSPLSPEGAQCRKPVACSHGVLNKKHQKSLEPEASPLMPNLEKDATSLNQLEQTCASRGHGRLHHALDCTDTPDFEGTRHAKSTLPSPLYHSTAHHTADTVIAVDKPQGASGRVASLGDVECPVPPSPKSPTLEAAGPM
jgi:hypothetical protein